MDKSTAIKLATWINHEDPLIEARWWSSTGWDAVVTIVDSTGYVTVLRSPEDWEDRKRAR